MSSAVTDAKNIPETTGTTSMALANYVPAKAMKAKNKNKNKKKEKKKDLKHVWYSKGRLPLSPRH